MLILKFILHASALTPCVCLLQDLVGVMPDMGSTIASKLIDLSADNTSLTQCDTTHLAALRSSNYTGEVTSMISCMMNRAFLVCLNECAQVAADRSAVSMLH